MKSKKDIEADDDYKLTLVYHKIVYCKKREIDKYIEEAKKNRFFIYSMPEKLRGIK